MGSPIYEEIRQLDCSFLIKPIKRNRLHHALRTIFPAPETPRISSPGPSSPAFPMNLATRLPLTILCAEDNPIKCAPTLLACHLARVLTLMDPLFELRSVKVITHLLKRMGYTCDVAEDGKVALEKAQKKRYDLILQVLSIRPSSQFLSLTPFTSTHRMDVNMPVMDGITSTKKIIEVMPDRNSR